MSRLFCLIFCVLCLDFAARTEGIRVARSSGASSGASSSSSSSSSSGSFGGSGLTGQGAYGGHNSYGTGGYGPTYGTYGGNFNFPVPGFQQFPGGLPFQDFNALYQQFLSNLYAAQAYAAQNSAYAPIFQQQLTSLIAQQQAAMAQIPSAFPSVDSNTIAHGTGPVPGGTYHSTVGGSTYPGPSQSSSSSGSFSGTGGHGGGSNIYTRTGGPAGGGTVYSGTATPAGGSGVYSGSTVHPTGSGSGSVYTGASVNYGPQGGHGQASAFPGGSDGLGVRIAEEFPAPGGGSFGVFSSSSSGTSNINGKTTSFKTSTFGTNDNGKITFRTVNE